MTDLILLTLQDIPGSGKFKKRSLQNEEDMRIMFGDITNDESDHWNPMSSNPIIPPSRDDVYDIPKDGDGGDDINNDAGLDMGLIMTMRFRRVLLLLPLL